MLLGGCGEDGDGDNAAVSPFLDTGADESALWSQVEVMYASCSV
jgi:hypothetical protein